MKTRINIRTYILTIIGICNERKERKKTNLDMDKQQWWEYH